MNDVKHIIAIDLGSNSFHLVIAKEHENAITIVESHKERVSLSSGLDKSDHLSQQAIARGINCLKVFSQRFNLLPLSQVRVVATHTLRKAVNSAEFIKAAKEVLAYPIEIVDGHTEAELIYSGVAHTQPLSGKTLVIDIGGGSTELIIGKGFTASITDSLDLGSGQLTKLFFTDNQITEHAFMQAYAHSIIQLRSIADRYRKFGWKSAVGTSGSIKLIQQVLKELNGSSKISLKRLRRLQKQLISWGSIDKVPLVSVKTEKLDILPSAVAILIACFDILALEEIKFSSAALREGVLYGLSQSRSDIDIRKRTLNTMTRLYHTDNLFSQRVINQLHYFIKQLKDNHKITEHEINCLLWAAQLHEIGLHINTKKRQKHAAYILANSDMLGFNPTELELITLLVKHHRGKLSIDEQIAPISQQNTLLITLFRLAIICTQGRLNLPLLAIKVALISDGLSLDLDEKNLLNHALTSSLAAEKVHLNNINFKLNYNDKVNSITETSLVQ